VTLFSPMLTTAFFVGKGEIYIFYSSSFFSPIFTVGGFDKTEVGDRLSLPPSYVIGKGMERRKPSFPPLVNFLPEE